jgi:hypothetical protein
MAIEGYVIEARRGRVSGAEILHGKVFAALPLADELFLVGHDQYRGRPHVDDHVLDTGLAGAVLGEMVLARRLRVGSDTMVAVADGRPYGDRVSDAALAEVLKQDGPHSVQAWVEYLRGHVRDMVATRLILRGLLRPPSVGRVEDQRRFPAVDPVMAAAPQTRLGYLIARPGREDPQSAALGALTLATGLDRVVGWPSDGRTRAGLARMHASLEPDLHALVLGVAAATAHVSLS